MRVRLYSLTLIAVLAAATVSTTHAAETSALEKGQADKLAEAFRNPPADAAPWTYWFWINGNITKEGITADLEAMARVGIKGVLIMEVAGHDKFAPDGPVAFGSPEWREMFKHAVAEARRLGLQVNMNNDAGWCGSGGPWNTPEFSMQKLVSTKTPVQGGKRFEGILPKPKEVEGFYRDIKLFAYPDPGKDKSATVPAESVLDLTSNTASDGRLTWDAPEGNWIVLRIGHTSTGRKNHPAPEAGLGLECDKFSAEAMKRHFDGFIGKLADDVGPDAGTAFTQTHIDSWEVASQDWTPRMAEEFRTRCGYDLMPWLVSLAGGPRIGSAEQTERFRRDFDRTRCELTAEAYAGALRKLANSRGLKLSIEGYGPNGITIDPLLYGQQADLPMAEFWVMRWSAWHLYSSRLMASMAHATGKRVVGAESFTSIAQNDAWTEHPYSIKSTGDWAFCEGVNRFVFHRYALQPWTTFLPGMTMSGYGTHFDRTQTWFEPGAAFMRYLARCQYLLQEGEFVADICRLVPDAENYGHSPLMMTLPQQYAPLPSGYNYDYLSDRTLLAKASVRDGRIVIGGGIGYRVLQLPNHETMTPELLRKLRDLVQVGAVISGPRPKRSPSLTGYPQCDQEVERLAAELWGDCDGKAVTQHTFGKGRVTWNEPIEVALVEGTGTQDFGYSIDPPLSQKAIESPTLGKGSLMGKDPPALMPTQGLNWIHRRIGGAEVYFIANPQYRAVESLCMFSVQGKQPEFWDPATGEIRSPAISVPIEKGTGVPIHFDPAGSVLVVFREAATPETQVVELKRGGEVLIGAKQPRPGAAESLWRIGDKVSVQVAVPGKYEVTFANGKTRSFDVSAAAPSLNITGPWTVAFPPGRGAPASAEFPVLKDWAKHETEGIRYFSGTATYTLQFDRPATSPGEHLRWQLDLGEVRVMAEVKLNGKDLGVLWKPPFVVDVSDAIKPGRNELEVQVTNLWPNRLIGDEQYPDDCTPNGTWKAGNIPAWPEWLLKHQPRPEPRRVTFTTWKYYKKDSPLLPSGLMGPVALRAEHVEVVDAAR